MKESLVELWAKFRDEIWETDPHYREFMATLTELNRETDRGVALVTTSFLDMLMGDSIAAFLIHSSSAEKLLAGFLGGSRRSTEHKEAANNAGNASWKIHGFAPSDARDVLRRTVAATYVEMRDAGGQGTPRLRSKSSIVTSKRY